MILHIPAGGGKPLLISIPRDSYVNIPGYGMNKINAAFSFGGPSAAGQDHPERHRPVHQSLHGHRLRRVRPRGQRRRRRPDVPDHRLHDRASGLHLHRRAARSSTARRRWPTSGTGTSFATQDLQREQDQRIFLSGAAEEDDEPRRDAQPVRRRSRPPAASSSTLTVDQGTSLYQLYGVAQALRNPETTTVPIANANYLDLGRGRGAVGQRRRPGGCSPTCRPVRRSPRSLITGSHQGDLSLTGAAREPVVRASLSARSAGRAFTDKRGQQPQLKCSWRIERHMSCAGQPQDAFS